MRGEAESRVQTHLLWMARDRRKGRGTPPPRSLRDDSPLKLSAQLPAAVSTVSPHPRRAQGSLNGVNLLQEARWPFSGPGCPAGMAWGPMRGGLPPPATSCHLLDRTAEQEVPLLTQPFGENTSEKYRARCPRPEAGLAEPGQLATSPSSRCPGGRCARGWEAGKGQCPRGSGLPPGAGGGHGEGDAAGHGELAPAPARGGGDTGRLWTRISWNSTQGHSAQKAGCSADDRASERVASWSGPGPSWP